MRPTRPSQEASKEAKDLEKFLAKYASLPPEWSTIKMIGEQARKEFERRGLQCRIDPYEATDQITITASQEITSRKDVKTYMLVVEPDYRNEKIRAKLLEGSKFGRWDKAYPLLPLPDEKDRTRPEQPKPSQARTQTRPSATSPATMPDVALGVDKAAKNIDDLLCKTAKDIISVAALMGSEVNYGTDGKNTTIVSYHRFSDLGEVTLLEGTMTRLACRGKGYCTCSNDRKDEHILAVRNNPK